MNLAPLPETLDRITDAYADAHAAWCKYRDARIAGENTDELEPAYLEARGKYRVAVIEMMEDEMHAAIDRYARNSAKLVADWETLVGLDTFLRQEHMPSPIAPQFIRETKLPCPIGGKPVALDGHQAEPFRGRLDELLSDVGMEMFDGPPVRPLKKRVERAEEDQLRHNLPADHVNAPIGK